MEPPTQPSCWLLTDDNSQNSQGKTTFCYGDTVLREISSLVLSMLCSFQTCRNMASSVVFSKQYDVN